MFIDSAFLVAILIITFITYYPARNLFFRNDEWEQIYFIEKALNSKKALWSYIKGTEFAVVKHFIPFGHISYFLRYYFCRYNFSCHLLTNLSIHLINIILVYNVALTLGIDQYTALFVTLLFALTPVIADTIFWPIMSLNTLVTMFILISLLTHPAFSGNSILNSAIFIISLILAALTMEFGLLAACLAFGLFMIYGKLDLYALILSILPIAVYFAGRRLIIGSFSLNREQKTPLISISKMLSNIYTGFFKLLLSNFAAIFNIKATDTLYILKPDYKKTQTIFSMLIVAILIITSILFFQNNEIGSENKWLSFILFGLVCASFFIVSFGVEKSNPNPDLPHQMPRFYYLPASIMVLVIGLCLTYLPFWKMYIYIILASYIGTNNFLSIRHQAAILRPHTDSMKRDTEAFIDTGLMPQRQIKTCIDDYRLDWSFNEYSISAYYKIKMKGKIDFDPKTHNELGERLFNEGKIEEAKSAFVNAIALNPKFAVPYNNLGVLFFQSGNYDLSYQYFIKGIYLAPNNKELAVNFIYLLININSYDSAEAICRFSIHHNPNDKELFALLSVIRSKRDN